MEYEDRITIATPEGVDVELMLAGVGSRFVSALVDVVLQTALLLAVVGLGVFAAGLGGTGFGQALIFVASFIVFAAYDVLFEVFASGRTPGKRMNGLRVVRLDGSPVTFFTSAVRNVLRVVDFLPSAYLVGIASILVTRRNQRLGDLTAGTLVVRELGAPRELRPLSIRAGSTSWDVTAVTAEELATVRSFLARRDELVHEARYQLADDLARALRPKVVGAPDGLGSETFLEQLAAAKAFRS